MRGPQRDTLRPPKQTLLVGHLLFAPLWRPFESNVFNVEYLCQSTCTQNRELQIEEGGLTRGTRTSSGADPPAFQQDPWISAELSDKVACLTPWFYNRI